MASPLTSNQNLELAIQAHRAGNFDGALQRYRTLLQENELNAQAHNNLGLLYQERGLLQDSVHELQRAAAIDPRNPGTHNNYGVTLLMLGRTDEAVAEFQSVLRLEPGNLDARVNLALAERSAGRFDAAKEALLDVLNRAPANAPANYNLAQLYDQTNEPARAVEHYRLFLDHAGVEHAGRAAAVRARIAALSKMPE
jgi:Tfp pilus assembly protein PilF